MAWQADRQAEGRLASGSMKSPRRRLCRCSMLPVSHLKGVYEGALGGGWSWPSASQGIPLQNLRATGDICLACGDISSGLAATPLLWRIEERLSELSRSKSWWLAIRSSRRPFA